MLTGILIFWPLVMAALLLLGKGESLKRIAFIGSLVQLGITAYVVSQFQPTADTQFLMDYWWVKSLGISFKVGIDGISLLLVILTNVLVPLIILTSYKHNYNNPSLFYSLIM